MLFVEHKLNRPFSSGVQHRELDHCAVRHPGPEPPVLLDPGPGARPAPGSLLHVVPAVRDACLTGRRRARRAWIPRV